MLNHEYHFEERLRGIRTKLDSLDPEVIVAYDVTTRVTQRDFGSALRAGFEAAGGNVGAPVMATRSDDMAVIPRMVGEIEAADVVAGCGSMAGGGIVGDTIMQRFSRRCSRVLTQTGQIQKS